MIGNLINSAKRVGYRVLNEATNATGLLRSFLPKVQQANSFVGEVSKSVRDSKFAPEVLKQAAGKINDGSKQVGSLIDRGSAGLENLNKRLNAMNTFH